MKIAVIGAGGIGTHLIHMLVNTIDSADEIVIFDGDEFEEKNLNRQLFGSDMLAENKAYAMKRMYGHLADIRAVEDYVEEPDCLSEFDLVFCVPDNNLARRIAISSADMYGFTLIVAGNESTSANAIVHCNTITNISAKAHAIESHPEYLRDSAPENSCSANVNANPQTIVANNIAACMCMGLFEVWREDITAIYTNEILASAIPIEYEWGRTFFKKHTISDLTCQKSIEEYENDSEG